MLRWFQDRFFPLTSIRGLTEAQEVKVEGMILDAGPTYESTMTPRTGLLIEYRFFDRYDAGQRGGEEALYRPGAMGRLGDFLRVEVEGRRVQVPLDDRVILKFLSDWTPSLVPNLLPEELAAAHPELEELRGQLCYDERTLHPGQWVRMKGWLAPVAAPGGSVYRQGQRPEWDFIALPDRGPFTITEL